MTDRQRYLLQTIEEEFRGVELGEGVSLHETEIIDNYGSVAERQESRALDEKHDWRKLVDDPELARIRWVGGLSFYDATGLRFHLPAYLSLAVIGFERADTGEIMESLMFHLTSFSDYNLARFSTLTGPQRRCVREVLEFLRGEHELESAELEQAISGYWSSVP